MAVSCWVSRSRRAEIPIVTDLVSFRIVFYRPEKMSSTSAFETNNGFALTVMATSTLPGSTHVKWNKVCLRLGNKKKNGKKKKKEKKRKEKKVKGEHKREERIREKNSLGALDLLRIGEAAQLFERRASIQKRTLIRKKEREGRREGGNGSRKLEGSDLL